MPTGGATILPGSTVLDIARSAELSPTFPLTGALDDITIYDRAHWSPKRSPSCRSNRLPTRSSQREAIYSAAAGTASAVNFAKNWRSFSLRASET